MFKIHTKLIILLALLLFTPSTVFAVVMTFEPPNVTSNQTKPFSTTLVLNSEQQSINAVDGTLIVSEALAKNVTLSDSGSIVTYWVTRPTYDPATRTIKFSGTIPGGFDGQAGILFSVIFEPISGGGIENALVVGEANTYLNDGMGTVAKVSTKQFALSSDGSGPVDTEIASQLYLTEDKQDNIPPETFSPQLAQDERVFDGKWFVNFATTDKQSGISHYEVQESRSGRLDSGNWKRAASPYLLQDQDLNSFIYVVAVDRQGNERMIKVYPRRPLKWWQQYQNDVAVGIGILLTLTAVAWYNQRKRKPKQSLPHV